MPFARVKLLVSEKLFVCVSVVPLVVVSVSLDDFCSPKTAPPRFAPIPIPTAAPIGPPAKNPIAPPAIAPPMVANIPLPLEDERPSVFE